MSSKEQCLAGVSRSRLPPIFAAKKVLLLPPSVALKNVLLTTQPIVVARKHVLYVSASGKILFIPSWSKAPTCAPFCGASRHDLVDVDHHMSPIQKARSFRRLALICCKGFTALVEKKKDQERSRPKKSLCVQVIEVRAPHGSHGFFFRQTLS